MNNIPTAEEYIKKFNLEGDEGTLSKKNLIWMLEDFAKQKSLYHVEAALKAALESIPCLGSSTDIATYEEVEKEVLNSYPKENIK